MAQTFENILKSMKAEQRKLLEPKAMEWYLQQIKKVVQKMPAGEIPRRTATERQKAAAKSEVEGHAIMTQNFMSEDLAGKMIFYAYDPKWAHELPYYDTFPLVFPIEPVDAHSFLGLNMHYLPLSHRAKFMTSLYSLINIKDKTKMDDPRIKLRLQYEFLKGSSKYAPFKPCLKRYLTSHIRSRIIVIKPDQWNYVLLMPLARFEKKSELKVWQDSVDMIKPNVGRR